MDDLVGTAEIAERLGLARPNVIHDWRRRYPDFPEPVAALKQALIWEWSAVKAWSRATGHPKR